MADSPPGGMIPLKRWEITSLVGVGRHLVVVCFLHQIGHLRVVVQVCQ
jgi:endonuclease III